MGDPYTILGVRRNATADEVKKAYRELAVKYHPDKYVGNSLAELAEAKMKEINEAYDAILKEREGGNNYDYGSQQPGRTSKRHIRVLIERSRLDEAETALRLCVPHERDAEWYFLMGSIAYRRGWFDEAQRNWNTAVTMEPNNPEYRQAYYRVRQNPFTDYNRPGNMGEQGCSACDCCTAMLCADCLCGFCR
jgi:tetratricopeptide (TPR) repeat protein